MKTLSIIAIVISLAAVGCSNQIQVVDRDGKPVRGATIQPQTPSTNGTPVKTDANGNADIPSFDGGEVRWVEVSKVGFTTQVASVPAKGPLKVVLQP